MQQRPKVATLFVSAHGEEFPLLSLPAVNIPEIRVLYSQSCAGTPNYENDIGISTELIHWTKKFNTLPGSTYDILEETKEELESNKSIDKQLQDLGRTRDKKKQNPRIIREVLSNHFSDFYEKIERVLDDQGIYVSDPTLETSMKKNILKVSHDLHKAGLLQDIVHAIKHSGTTTMRSKLRNMVFTDTELMALMTEVYEDILNRQLHYSTKHYSLKCPIMDKLYQVTSNDGEETLDEIKKNYYGIHLIFDSELGSDVDLYHGGILNENNNIISYHSIPSDHGGTPYLHTGDVKGSTALSAKRHFTQLISRDRDVGDYSIPAGCVMLSEIIQFFHDEEYIALNIIDTSCRGLVWKDPVIPDHLPEDQKTRIRLDRQLTKNQKIISINKAEKEKCKRLDKTLGIRKSHSPNTIKTIKTHKRSRSRHRHLKKKKSVRRCLS